MPDDVLASVEPVTSSPRNNLDDPGIDHRVDILAGHGDGDVVVPISVGVSCGQRGTKPVTRLERSLNAIATLEIGLALIVGKSIDLPVHDIDASAASVVPGNADR